MTNTELVPDNTGDSPAPEAPTSYNKRVTMQNGTEILASIVSETADSLTLDSELGRLTVQRENVRIEAYADASLDALGTLKLRDQLGMLAAYVKSADNQWRLIWQKNPELQPTAVLSDAYMSSSTVITYADLEKLYS